MATKDAHTKKIDETTIQQKIGEFLLKNRLVFISILAVFAISIVALLSVSAYMDSRNAALFQKIEDLGVEWSSAKSLGDPVALNAKETTILASLEEISGKASKSFPGARASMLAAEIYYAKKDWAKAEAAYVAAAEAMPEAYTAGLNLFNASVCAEESGNFDNAVAYLDRAVATPSFTQTSRALFNKGRIEEKRGNKTEAIAVFEKLSLESPENEWTLLAKSRLISLTIR